MLATKSITISRKKKKKKKLMKKQKKKKKRRRKKCPTFVYFYNASFIPFVGYLSAASNALWFYILERCQDWAIIIQ